MNGHHRFATRDEIMPTANGGWQRFGKFRCKRANGARYERAHPGIVDAAGERIDRNDTPSVKWRLIRWFDIRILEDYLLSVRDDWAAQRYALTFMCWRSGRSSTQPDCLDLARRVCNPGGNALEALLHGRYRNVSNHAFEAGLTLEEKLNRLLRWRMEDVPRGVVL